MMRYTGKGQMNRHWLNQSWLMGNHEHIIMPINCDNIHWMLADVEPKKITITVMDSYNADIMTKGSHLTKEIFNHHMTFLKLSGLLKSSYEYKQQKVKHRQRGAEDCGVYCVIFVQNILTGEHHEHQDNRENSLATRHLIAQSIFANRDIRDDVLAVQMDVDPCD